MSTDRSEGEKSPELGREKCIRVGRDERERCVEELQEHYAAGRLGEHEFADRVGTALTAITRSDLRMLLADLPGGAPGQADDRGTHRAFLLTLAGAVVVGVLGFGAVASGTAMSDPADEQTSICMATGRRRAREAAARSCSACSSRSSPTPTLPSARPSN